MYVSVEAATSNISFPRAPINVKLWCSYNGHKVALKTFYSDRLGADSKTSISGMLKKYLPDNQFADKEDKIEL